jgi:hypothetical protein
MSDVYYDAAVASYAAIRTEALAKPAGKTQAAPPNVVQPLIAEPPPFAGPQIPQPYPQVP